MRRFLGLSALLALLFAPVLAAAADKKDKEDEQEDEEETSAPVKVDEGAFKDDEEENAPKPARLDEGDKGEEGEDPEDDLDFEDKEDDDIDFRDEDTQESIKERGPGEDTAELYRDAQKKAKEMGPEEELLLWERYLEKYPNSLFKDRIEKHTEELSAALFGERVAGSDRGARAKDAALRELNFAIPLQYGSIDPRTHLSAGVEVGIPNWFAPRLDFEYAFRRDFSAHVGIKQEIKNVAVVLGPKYALIKSARTGTMLTGLLDVKVFTSPAYVSLHPGIGFGQRFDVLGGLDVQAQIGIDTELRDPVGLRYFYGAGAQLQASERVAAFFETTGNMKYLGNDDFEPFRFNVLSFGLKFNAAPGRDENGAGRLDVGLAANFPYTYRYWGFYQGAVTIMADWYL